MKKIILVNDDGIDAPGIEALYRSAEGLGERIVVAPEACCSGAGHRVTTHEPIRISRRREQWIAVGGTPADCSRVALMQVAPQADWVLSGINRGGNLGADVYISGTVAAAREAALLGCRAIALSQHTRPKLTVDWDWAARQCARVLAQLMERPLARGCFWNVNLPHLPPGSPDPSVVFCGLDFHPLHVRFRGEGGTDGEPSMIHFDGDYHQRLHEPGRDVAVCFGGSIAVTEIPLDIVR